MRQLAENIIGQEDFIEIFVDAPLAVCEQRDVKGLYQKARRGEITNFTGVDAPYEPPTNADLIVDTSSLDIESSVQLILHTFAGYLKKRPE